MVVIRKKNLADVTLSAGGYSPDQLRVVRFNGEEALSSPFRFTVDVASMEHALDLDAFLFQTGTLTFHNPRDKRHVHGLVTRMDQTGKGTRFSFYRLELKPCLWLYTLKQNIRIFQEKNVPDIIRTILTDGGMAGDEMEFRLKESYPGREYCVQYRETDLNFISRLMETEGIFYFFKHEKDRHVMVIADDPAVHLSIPSPDKVVFRPPTTTHAADIDFVSELTVSNRIRSGAVKLRDFHFEKPGLDLEAGIKGEQGKDLEIYDYPGDYTTSDIGQHYARVRLQQHQSTVRSGRGKGICRNFLPGYRFVLDEHPRAGFNEEYLLTRVLHRGQQQQSLTGETQGQATEVCTYENEFECIPADVPFRPDCKSRIPVINGSQTAIVTGPPGEEIYTDRYGRVKLRFHWDCEGQKNEKSSCWVRVSQGLAGAGWGMLFTPRINQEVVVSFLEGNPDRPLITGSVYNGQNLVPYGLPGQKTKSTIRSESSTGGGGNNEIRFEDKKGSEEIYIHAQKDNDNRIENNRTTYVGTDDLLDVDLGNRTTNVLNGTWELTAKDIKMTALNSFELVCSAGSIKIDAAGNMTVKALNLNSQASAIYEIKGALVKIN